jgi:hypothetical protein
MEVTRSTREGDDDFPVLSLRQWRIIRAAKRMSK